MGAGKDRRPRRSRGELVNTAVLTEQQVREIRGLYATGKWTYASLAAQYNVYYTTIRAIVKRQTWRHI